MMPEFHRHDQWWVSPFNVIDEVRRSFSLPPRVQVHDATLRDGEQTPGVVFSVADKIAIAETLAAVGVDRIEAGMPAVSDDDFAAVRQITRLGLTSKIYTFVRAITADIDKSLQCGARGVILEIPIGYPKLLWQFKWTWEDVLRKSVAVVRYAKGHDTEVVHSCANGLGERTGNAALEELIVALHVLYGYETPYRLDRLPELGALVSRLSNLPIAVNKPVLGAHNFTRESGIGVDLVVTKPLAMFGTHPALPGRSGDVVLGKKSGKASITYSLEQLGLAGVSDEAVSEMLRIVKERSIAKRALVTLEEFREIAERVLAGAAHSS